MLDDWVLDFRSPCQSKIQNFNLPSVTHNNIVRLKIPVNNSLIVSRLEPLSRTWGRGNQRYHPA